jgi:hypothetical protein
MHVCLCSQLHIHTNIYNNTNNTLTHTHTFTEHWKGASNRALSLIRRASRVHSPQHVHSSISGINMHICVFVCVCVYIYIYIHVYVCIYSICAQFYFRYKYAHMCVCVCVCIYIYIHVYIYAYIQHVHNSISGINMHICVFVCVCVYIYIYMYIYMHIFNMCTIPFLVYIYTCVYIYIYIYIYTCMCMISRMQPATCMHFPTRVWLKTGQRMPGCPQHVRTFVLFYSECSSHAFHLPRAFDVVMRVSYIHTYSHTHIDLHAYI